MAIRQRDALATLCAVLAIAALPASPVAAATFDVTTTADGGAGSLRAAIEAANADLAGTHTLRFADSFPQDGVIAIGSPLPTLRARFVSLVGNGRRPVIDGGGTRQILGAGNSLLLLEIDGITLRGGRATFFGGGCLRSQGTVSTPVTQSLFVYDSAFIDCSSDAAAGAISWWSDGLSLVHIENALFEGSAATNAATQDASHGALYVNAGQISLDSSTFRGNRADRGSSAATLLSSAGFGSVTVSGSRFFGNASLQDAATASGALVLACANDCAIELSASSFSDNTGGRRGTLRVSGPFSGNGTYRALAYLHNNTFIRNATVDGGGAAAIEYVDLDARHNTFFDNDSTLGVAQLAFTSVRVERWAYNLMRGPERDACAATGLVITAPRQGNVYDRACATLGDAGGVVATPLQFGEATPEPALEPVAVHLSGSLAIDIGNGAECLPRDARGVPRPQDGDRDGIVACDAGAIERFEPRIFQNGFE